MMRTQVKRAIMTAQMLVDGLGDGILPPVKAEVAGSRPVRTASTFNRSLASAGRPVNMARRCGYPVARSTDRRPAARAAGLSSLSIWLSSSGNRCGRL